MQVLLVAFAAAAAAAAVVVVIVVVVVAIVCCSHWCSVVEGNTCLIAKQQSVPNNEYVQ